MEAVYGAQLAYFPELFAQYPVFDMLPLVGGKGFGPRTNVQEISAVMQKSPGGALAIEADLRQEGGKALIWIPEDDASKVSQGRYLLDGKDLYLFENDNNFLREGGFIRFGIKRVVGTTGQQKVDESVDLGISDYE
jgi:hypothetical protein